MEQETLIKEIETDQIIVIIRGYSGETLIHLVNAIIKGGVHYVELPFDQSGKTPDEEIAENIKLLKTTFEKDLHVGAGTVLTVEQVETAANAGAEYIISPDTFEPVIRKTKELGLVSIPGAFTPSEVTHAHRCGADFIKLFPNSEIKPSYLKAISLPLSHIKFLVVGGVNLENIGEYKAAGAKGYGIAGAIVNKALIESKKFDEITKITNEFVQKIK